MKLRDGSPLWVLVVHTQFDDPNPFSSSWESQGLGDILFGLALDIKAYCSVLCFFKLLYKWNIVILCS